MFFLYFKLIYWKLYSHWVFEGSGYKLVVDSHLLDHRYRYRYRRYRRHDRHFRLRRFMFDTAVERGCPVSRSLTWILCGNQDLLLKHGTARERRKERQEQTNGESDRTTRRETETSREEDGEGEDSLLLVRHRSVVLQGAHGALPRGFSRDRSESHIARGINLLKDD